jgi:hypothetical protein
MAWITRRRVSFKIAFNFLKNYFKWNKKFLIFYLFKHRQAPPTGVVIRFFPGEQVKHWLLPDPEQDSHEKWHNKHTVALLS